MRDLPALYRYFADRSAMPFEWGHDKNDCVSFAVGAVHAQTGREFSFGLHRWSSAAGAMRVLKRLGGLEACVDRELERVRLPFAQRGDVAAVDGPRGLILMIVEGDTLVGPDFHGLARLPRTAAKIFWNAE